MVSEGQVKLVHDVVHLLYIGDIQVIVYLNEVVIMKFGHFHLKVRVLVHQFLNCFDLLHALFQYLLLIIALRHLKVDVDRQLLHNLFENYLFF
jgi:hypothetical protein